MVRGYIFATILQNFCIHLPLITNKIVQSLWVMSRFSFFFPCKTDRQAAIRLAGQTHTQGTLQSSICCSTGLNKPAYITVWYMQRQLLSVTDERVSVVELQEHLSRGHHPHRILPSRPAPQACLFMLPVGLSRSHDRNCVSSMLLDPQLQFLLVTSSGGENTLRNGSRISTRIHTCVLKQKSTQEST